MLTIIDQTASKVWEDQAVILEFYGSTDGQHAFDLNDAVPTADLSVGAIDSTQIAANAITSAKLASGALTTGNIDGGVFTKIASDVNTEVLDVITVDTFGESTAVPAALATIERKLAWMGTLSRNELRQNSTSQFLLGDTGNQIATASVSVSTSVEANTTTVVRGEFS